MNVIHNKCLVMLSKIIFSIEIKIFQCNRSSLRCVQRTFRDGNTPFASVYILCYCEATKPKGKSHEKHNIYTPVKQSSNFSCVFLRVSLPIY